MSPRPRTSLLLGGTLLFGLLILGPSGAAVAANGQVCMGVVVDDGPNSSQPNWAPAAVRTAQIAPGTTDLQALVAAGDTATQNNSGLVCAIDNFPANGLQDCLSTSGGGQFYYWSYWEGDPYSNTWTYASIGPAEHTVSSGQTYVEGWRFQDPGADNSSAPKPSMTPAAAFAQACPGVQPVPSGGSGGGAGSGSGGGNSGSGGSSPVTPGPSASATPTSSVPGPSSPGPQTAAGGGASSEGDTTTTSHPATGANPPSRAAQGASTTTTTAGRSTNGGGNKTALADARGHGASGGGDPALPIVVVAAVIVLLGGLAWWRWRRRPLEE
jgi:hypothetical protein